MFERVEQKRFQEETFEDLELQEQKELLRAKVAVTYSNLMLSGKQKEIFNQLREMGYPVRGIL